MAKRREKGDGSIYQRSSDGMFVAYARLDNKKKKYVYAKTRKEVAVKLKTLQRSIEQKTIVTAKDETVEAYLAYWLQIRHNQGEIKESTCNTYKQYFKTVCVYIGNMKLQKLTGDQIQTMYNKLRKEQHYKASTIKTIHNILSTAFKQAIRWKKLANNPCEDADPPTVEKYEGPILLPEQAVQLLSAAQGDSIEIFLIIALGTGLRRGEIIGLKWSMIDLDKRQLLVEKTASYLPDEHGKYRTVATTPKTKNSRRALALPQFVVDALKTYKVKQMKQRLATLSWENNDLIFCDSKGHYFNISTLRYRFKRLLTLQGLSLEMHIHDLRHSAAAYLLKMGVPMKVISEILGHSSIKITMDIYGHLLPGMQEDAMGKMDDLFGEK